MKLNKTWMGICVWILYAAGIGFAAFVTSFVSGLFHVYGRLASAAAVTVVMLLSAFIVAFAGCSISKILRKKTTLFSAAKPPVFAEVLLPVIIIILTAVLYPMYMRMTSLSGEVSLIDAAVVSEEGVSIAGMTLPGQIYSVKLNVLMSLLGNGTGTAIVFQVILRSLLMVFMYITLRKSIGILGGFAATVTVAAVPVFGYSLNNISEMNLFLVYLWFALMLIVFWLKGFESDKGNKLYYVIFDIICGTMTGFVLFQDPVAVCVILVAAAVFFIKGEETGLVHRLGHFMFLLIAAAVTFGILVSIYMGSGDVVYAFWKWLYEYIKAPGSEWIILMGGAFYDKLLGIIIVAACAIPVFGYFLSGRNERILPFILYVTGTAALSVILDGTYIDDQVSLFMLAAVLIGCGASCFAYRKEETAICEAEVSEGENTLEEETKGVSEQIVPEKVAEDEEKQTETPEKVTPKAPTLEEEKDASSNDDRDDEKEQPAEDKPRFVPEGMVLPTGDEDEEDLEPHFNLNRPEMTDIGVISLSRNSDESEENEKENKEDQPPKDDFDLDIEPGDDFDI